MLINNGIVVTWGPANQVLENHSIYMDGDRIREIGPTRALAEKHPGESALDARGQLVMPGNICAHTHFYGAFARGLAIPGDAPADFPQILQKLWWPLDKSLDAPAVRASAQVCLVEAIKHGTTALIDHHASPNAIDGSLDQIADAVDESGLRAVLCYEVTDRDGAAKMKAGIAENVRFLKEEHGPRIAGAFGLHASLTLSDASLDACRSAAPENTAFHIHVAEHEADEQDSVGKSGKRVAQRLQAHNILGPTTIAAHGVHLDDAERALLAETGTWLTHQPRSNMNNGVGVAPVEDMLGRGIKVCLGNDGFSNAMWEEWKAAYLLHKVHHRDPRRLGGMDVVKMAVHNNAALAGQFFPAAPLGTIEPGAFADIILVDYHPFTPLTSGNLPWHILFGFEPDMVTTTIVGGRVLMKDRVLQTVDEAEIAAAARSLAPSIWKRYQEHIQ